MEMPGTRLPNGSYTGNISQILAVTGMKPKFVALPAKAIPEEVEMVGGKFLGVGYEITGDRITFTVVNSAQVLPQGRGRRRDSVTWSRADIEGMRAGTKALTARCVLSWTMGIYNPLGLVSPLVLRAKVLLRRLQGKGRPLPWDRDMNREEKARWADLLQEILQSKALRFPHSAAPEAEGPIHIVAFADGSLMGICAAHYLVWEQVKVGQQSSALLIAKSRLALLQGTTTPQAELSGLVLALRLSTLAVTMVNFRLASLSVLTDSQCTVAMTEKTGSMLKPYAANRVGEIEELSRDIRKHVTILHPIAAITGEDNPADLGTRGRVTLEELGRGSGNKVRTSWPSLAPSGPSEYPSQVVSPLRS